MIVIPSIHLQDQQPGKAYPRRTTHQSSRESCLQLRRPPESPVLFRRPRTTSKTPRRFRCRALDMPRVSLPRSRRSDECDWPVVARDHDKLYTAPQYPFHFCDRRGSSAHVCSVAYTVLTLIQQNKITSRLLNCDKGQLSQHSTDTSMGLISSDGWIAAWNEMWPVGAEQIYSESTIIDYGLEGPWASRDAVWV